MSHWHNAETSVWKFFVYLLQHHVKVLPLNLLSELARSALYKVFAYSYIMCYVLCSLWTKLSKWVFQPVCDIVLQYFVISVVPSKTLQIIYLFA